MATAVDHYAVMGNPITHSKSPFIHALFAEATGQKLHYAAQLVEQNGFSQAIEFYFDQGGHLGLSVTVPFKEQAWQLAEIKTERAEKAGALNTLWLDGEGKLNGDNTDGLGLVRDLKVNNGISLKDARVLILGAGGAVRGVLEPLLTEQPKEIVIANRTVSKAETLANLFLGQPVSGCGFSDVSGSFDVIINGTSASLQGELPPVSGSVVTGNTTCYDMMYSKDTTVFNQWALNQGAGKVIDGLGMLVEQAAEQFVIWRGVRPDTDAVFKILREEMS